MKTSLSVLHSLLPMLVVTTSLHAIEAPEDDSPPPAEALKQQADTAPGPEQRDAKAFLGIVTQPVPEVLREHLGLKAPHGIIVRSVFPEGPAAKAGIAPHDVITGIGGKDINTPEQLTNTIGSHKPGDKINVALVHQGESREIEVTLGERPAHIPMAKRDANEAAPEGLALPEEFADRIRRMLEDNAGGIEFPFMNEGNFFPDPEINGAMQELQQRLNEAGKGLDMFQLGDGNGNLQFNQAATFRMMDDEGSVEVKSENGSKEVTVRDRENNIIWNGPWDTDQDKAAAPDDIRKRIERLNIQQGGNGLRLQFGPGRNR